MEEIVFAVVVIGLLAWLLKQQYNKGDGPDKPGKGDQGMDAGDGGGA